MIIGPVIQFDRDAVGVFHKHLKQVHGRDLPFPKRISLVLQPRDKLFGFLRPKRDVIKRAGTIQGFSRNVAAEVFLKSGRIFGIDTGGLSRASSAPRGRPVVGPRWTR